jgi:hypothetical protein
MPELSGVDHLQRKESHMSWTRSARITAVAAAVALLGTAGAAQAVSSLKSFQGADYSTNSTTGRTVYACDAENDSHDVSADYVRSGSSTEFHVIDTYEPGCTAGGLSTVVYKHRAVELLPLTDAYGDWVYPA